MSRSIKGKKPPGFDYWGRRGIKDKKTTKGIERMASKEEIYKVIRSLDGKKARNKDHV